MATLTGAGVAAERQGMLTEARRYFEQARLRAPGSATVQNNLGAVLYRLGEVDEARSAFRQALVLSRGSSDIPARNLAIIDAAIQRATASEDPPLARNPHQLERLGQARYRLMASSAAQENG